jgi:hypothetical protein
VISTMACSGIAVRGRPAGYRKIQDTRYRIKDTAGGGGYVEHVRLYNALTAGGPAVGWRWRVATVVNETRCNLDAV